MQIEKIDRILVAVRDLGIASKFFSDLLGLKFDEINVDEQEKVQYVRSALGLELIQSTSPDGPVARFIEKRGEGLYAFTLKVDDIEVAMEEMQKKGLIAAVTKNPKGKEYSRRMRWHLTEKTYSAYKKLGQTGL